MGLFDSVFGGGDGGGDVQQAETLTPEQKTLLTSMVTQLQGLVPQALTPTGPQQFAGISPLQQQAFSGFGQLGGLGNQGINIAQQGLAGFDPSQSQGFLSQAGGALEQGLQGFDPQNILDALEPGQQLAQNQFNQQTVPGLQERFGASSGGSGALNKALAEAGANLSLGLNAQAAPFLGQAALNAPGQQLQGAGLAGNLAQLPGQLANQAFGFGAQGSDLLGQLLNVGGLQRGIAQEPLNAQFQTAQQPANLLSAFGPLGLGTQAFTNFQNQQQPGLISSLLPALGAFAGTKAGSSALAGGLGSLFGGGAAAGGAGAATTMVGALSDRRVKENIKPVESALDKIDQLTGYSYNYIGNAPENRNGGVMAQDVEKVLPDAVSEINGIKMVRYDAVVGLLVEAIKELNNKIQEN